MRVGEGEFVAIIGPSSCRKSMPLGIIGGILKASHGRVFLEGHPASDCLNLLIFIFQDFAVLRGRIAGFYVTHNFHEALRLANRIVVLSRRPGRIKEVISVPIPQRERARKEVEGWLSDLDDRFWSLIRDAAPTADREVIHELNCHNGFGVAPRGSLPQPRFPRSNKTALFIDCLCRDDCGVAGLGFVGLDRSRVPAVARRDLCDNVVAHHQRRSVEQSLDLADAHRLGLVGRHGARRLPSDRRQSHAVGAGLAVLALTAVREIIQRGARFLE